MKRTRRSRWIDEVCEITRRKKLGEVVIAGRQHRRIRIEFAPEVNAAREREVCFDGIAATEIALDTGIDLITLRNSQARIEAARKVGIQHTKLAHQTRIHIERFGKAKILQR